MRSNFILIFLQDSFQYCLPICAYIYLEAYFLRFSLALQLLEVLACHPLLPSLPLSAYVGERSSSQFRADVPFIKMEWKIILDSASILFKTSARLIGSQNTFVVLLTVYRFGIWCIKWNERNITSAFKEHFVEWDICKLNKIMSWRYTPIDRLLVFLPFIHRQR